LVDLMLLAQDVDRVLEFLGRHANFQMRDDTAVGASGAVNPCRDMLDRLQACRNYLKVPDADSFSRGATLPSDADLSAAGELCREVEDIRKRELEAAEYLKRVVSARDEALAFANLKVSFSEIEHLTFLSMRIGKIDPARLGDLRSALGDRVTIVPLGSDGSKILAAASRKGRFALDTELKRFGFIPLELPKDFTGVPDELLAALTSQVSEATAQAAALDGERSRYAAARSAKLLGLLQSFSLGAQVSQVRASLESTQLVYRLTGWIAEDESGDLMKELDDLTEGRVAIRVYTPDELPTIRDGKEKVPVLFRHNPVVKSFERMIFSYGAPLYGTIDPTPVVAFFYTLLFGIMFGDLGQGAVFFLLGLALLSGKVSFLNRWRHFGFVFVSIGCASMAMGLLTGEFFANANVLKPFSRWVTGLYGPSEDRILELMPSRDSLDKMFLFFGFTVAVGFIINSVGLIINIANQLSLRRYAKAFFGKTGVAGAFFFWYVVFAAARIALTGGGIRWFDVVCVAVPLVVLFFAEPLERLVEGHRPIFENGVFSGVIGGIVEVLETITNFISNSVSFLRVGAFALSHAVLSYIVFTMTNLVGGSLSAGGILIGIFGNAVIICLEGLIVAIQVVRLQYYEFFSKFFTETGREFKPFRFKYKEG